MESLWKNSHLRIKALAVCALFALSVAGALAQAPDQGYKLLLTPQRLRRLQRDRERKTIRWANFERRVESVPDSPERGFELALYYAVTHDEARGREAAAWAIAHPCEQRQDALIRDWAGGLFTPTQRAVRHSPCVYVVGGPSQIPIARDQLFTSALTAEGASQKTLALEKYEGAVLESPAAMYALCEYLMTVRSLTHTDLRQENATFFRVLPKEFLLSLNPEQIQRPDWMAHIAALALVAVDPNLEGSQFLQGWAMEDSQTITEGPGVAYEFLWADPYLPGIAYRNLDPWVYDPAGRLFARTNWDAGSCWVTNISNGISQENCRAPALERPQTFGNLTLLPMFAPCLELPARANRQTLILWRLKPRERLTYRGEEKQQLSEAADAAGMWLVPENVQGKVCQGRDNRR